MSLVGLEMSLGPWTGDLSLIERALLGLNVGPALLRRGLSPKVACRNKWARIEALQRNQTFLDLYRAARADLLAGREALFPPGTWWLCRYAGLKAADAGATAPPS